MAVKKGAAEQKMNLQAELLKREADFYASKPLLDCSKSPKALQDSVRKLKEKSGIKKTRGFVLDTTSADAASRLKFG